MRFFARKRNKASLSAAELEEQLEDYKERDQFYLQVIHVLCYFIKEFSFDLVEIGADGFKDRIDQLAERLQLEETTKRLRNIFEGHKDAILSYINREKEYFEEKDVEFKNIIDILSKGIASLNVENQKFNSRIYEKSLQLEKITHLDDIRKIKEELNLEVNQIKQFVQQKKEQDDKQFETLYREAQHLKIDLEKAKKDSLTDGLTGVFNRLAFDSYIKTLIERNDIKRYPFSLLMLDIDNFKYINDIYGHRVGDRVLMALVHECKCLIRKDDFMARYGGEEFAIILPDAPLRAAVKKARMVCKAIGAKAYTADDLRPGENLSFTVSIGVSTYQEKDTVASMIDRADKALYLAKHRGKNQVISERKVSATQDA